jgi:integrase/recombinase XerC
LGFTINFTYFDISKIFLVHFQKIPDIPMISDFIKHLQFEKRYSSNTYESYQNDLEQFQSFLAVRYDLSDLKAVQTLHIRSWVVSLIQQKLSASSIHRKASSLKSFYKFLRQRNHIQHNPLNGVVLPKKGERLPVFVESQKLEQLFDHTTFPEGLEGQRDFLLMDFLYTTGMRRSELINLCWKDVDFSNHCIRVLGKGNKMRIIPLLPHLEKKLTEYRAAVQREFPELMINNILITDKGEMLYPKFVYNKVKLYLSAVTTIKKKSPHVLRHSFATHLTNNGAELNAIKDLLGHSSLASTQVYTHTSIENLKKVYEAAHPKAKK